MLFIANNCFPLPAHFLEYFLLLHLRFCSAIHKVFCLFEHYFHLPDYLFQHVNSLWQIRDKFVVASSGKHARHERSLSLTVLSSTNALCGWFVLGGEILKEWVFLCETATNFHSIFHAKLTWRPRAKQTPVIEKKTENAKQ